MKARNRIIHAAILAIVGLFLFYFGNRLGGHFEQAYYATLAEGSVFLIADAIDSFWPAWTANPFYVYTTESALLCGFGFSAILIGMTFWARGLGGGFYKEGEEHGTAKLEAPKSLRDYADHKGSYVDEKGLTHDNNLLLSANVKKQLDGNNKKRAFNKVSNVYVVAETGGGKTWEYVIQNMLQLASSLIVVDTKGTLYKRYASLFVMAYGEDNVRVLNVQRGLKYSQGFNPVKYLEDVEEVPDLVDNLIAVTKSPDEKTEWFDKAEGALIKALLAFCMEAIDGNGCEISMNDVLEMLDLMTMDERTLRRPFDILLEALTEDRPDNYTRKLYKGFCEFADSPKTTASILGSVHVRLQNMKSKSAARVLGRDEMNIEELFTERGVIFVQLDEAEPRPHQYLSALFFSTVLRQLAKAAQDSPDGRIEQHLHMLIDETYNCGLIQGLPSYASQIRSMGASMTTVWQSYGMTEEIYGEKGAAVIWQNSPTKIFLGGEDEDTNEKLSKAFGDSTVKKQGKSLTKGNSESNTASAQSLTRRVVMADELGRMKPPDMYIKVSGFNVVKDRRYDVTRHPNYKFTSHVTGELMDLRDVIDKKQVRPAGINRTEAGGYARYIDRLDQKKSIYISDIDLLKEQKGIA